MMRSMFMPAGKTTRLFAAAMRITGSKAVHGTRKAGQDHGALGLSDELRQLRHDFGLAWATTATIHIGGVVQEDEHAVILFLRITRECVMIERDAIG